LTVIAVPGCTAQSPYHVEISLWKYPGERERQSLSHAAPWRAGTARPTGSPRRRRTDADAGRNHTLRRRRHPARRHAPATGIDGYAAALDSALGLGASSSQLLRQSRVRPSEKSTRNWPVGSTSITTPVSSGMPRQRTFAPGTKCWWGAPLAARRFRRDVVTPLPTRLTAKSAMTPERETACCRRRARERAHDRGFRLRCPCHPDRSGYPSEPASQLAASVWATGRLAALRLLSPYAPHDWHLLPATERGCSGNPPAMTWNERGSARKVSAGPCMVLPA